jgi:mono/diheme cytochrome c family protein
MGSRLGVTFAMVPALALLAAAAVGAHAQTNEPHTWPGCCGLKPWAEAGPVRSTPRAATGPLRGFAYVVGGSPLRHHLGVTGQIPVPFATMKNPMSPTPQNAQAGAAVYDANCVSCHGATGLGDGPGSRTLSPPPARLGWLAKVPPGQRDAFMYWTIADGGARFRTAMPSYKGKLSQAEIWSVIGYIQARLPTGKAAGR